MACGIDILNVSITGDCSNTNSGGFSFELNVGGAPPYSISGISPVMSAVVLTGLTYEMTGMSGGGYSFLIQDSCPSGNVTTILNINISTGTCVSIETSDTTCGDNNGTITATTSTFYGTANYYVYETTLGFIVSATTAISGPYIFDSSNSTLSAGTYYVIADDGGGCTGRSESCIIKSSTTLNWDFYVVNDAGCNEAGSGAVYIQNLDGVPPYQFTWSNGAITQNVSGLTAGFYNVTVTDSTLCQQNKTVQVIDVPSVGLGAFFVTNPSCFATDGEVLVTITGGTGPYYYQGSNGQTFITFSQTQLFTNVPAGYFTVTVTDAALCNFTAGVELISPLGFSLTQIEVTNSYCNNQNGQVQVTVLSSAFPISYTLTDSLNNSTQYITNSQTQSFQGLSSDTYDLTISAGSCSLTTSVVVSNVPILELSYNVTGTTCDKCDGAIELIVSGGSAPYQFSLDNGQNVFLSTSSYTFTNLCSNIYKGSIYDPNPQRCTVTENIFVPPSSNVYFQLFFTNPSAYSNNGTIQALITQGTAPFSLSWSSNVNGQTGLTINNLSAGTYSLTVTDDDGCVYKQSVDLVGFVPLQSYQLYNICDSDFTNNGLLLTKGVKQMLLEGFYDLTSGDTNCVLDESYFTAIVTVGDITKTNTFYTGYTLNDYPSNQQWGEVTEEMLLTFEGITGVTTNVEDNQIKITTPCNTLDNALVKVDLLINYVISCESIAPTEPCYCFGFLDFNVGQEIEFTSCITGDVLAVTPAFWVGSAGRPPYVCSRTRPYRQDGLTGDSFNISASTCDNCCRCYIMSGNSQGIDPTGTTYQYIDCSGNLEEVTLSPGEELSVCASVIPWLISTDNQGYLYSNGTPGVNYFPLCTGSPPTCPT